MRKLNFYEWVRITNDQWVLDTVLNGYQIEFSVFPRFSSFMNEIKFSPNEAEIVSQEIDKLLFKGAIKKVDPVQGQFISNLFLVPKKDGSLRPVINLKNLNLFVDYQHFKQENLSFVFDIIQKDDFLTSIDLTDAYFSISIHDDFKKFLRFTWKGDILEFQVLSFGLACAPRVFTKILKPVFAFFRKFGIRCVFYIDDSLHMNQNFVDCQKETDFMVNKIDDLGFRVNRKKSVLSPTKRIIFFGLIIDTEVFKVFLTDEKIERIISLGTLILKQRNITIRCLSSFIGLIVHAFYAITLGPLHYRNLERNKNDELVCSNGDYDSNMLVSEYSVREITWWIDNVKLQNGKLIRPNPIDCWIDTDASLKGWGCRYEKFMIGGRWSVEEATHHINFLELLAIFLSLKAFFKDKRSLHIGIHSDNAVSVAYINDMGGMASLELDNLALEIWSWCTDRDLFLTAQYIPGSENFDADHMSRNFSDSTEWKLKTEIFDRLCAHFFNPDVDLFASRLNFQLPRFASWSFDPLASFTDAFTFSWSTLQPYIFPPFSLLGRILSKIMNDEVEKAILVVPFWPTQNWFPSLANSLISLPVRLPRHSDLLQQPHSGEPHPLQRTLNLIGCCVSGRLSLVREFQRHLQMSSLAHGEPQLSDSINIRGGSMYFGAVSERLIPFVRLKRMC